MRERKERNEWGNGCTEQSELELPRKYSDSKTGNYYKLGDALPKAEYCVFSTVHSMMVKGHFNCGRAWQATWLTDEEMEECVMSIPVSICLTLWRSDSGFTERV